MALNIAFLLFDKAAEMDFIAPYEVFNGSRVISQSGDNLYYVAETLDPVICFGGTRVLPDHTTETAPKPDILIVPGTGDIPSLKNSKLAGWVESVAPSCSWVAGVCTGSILLAEAGLLAGKRATTHFTCIELLKSYKDVTVLEKTRYVRDGNLVTSAGVSAGLDMALWLVGQVVSREQARAVQQILEYFPAPPYAAEV